MSAAGCEDSPVLFNLTYSYVFLVKKMKKWIRIRIRIRIRIPYSYSTALGGPTPNRLVYKISYQKLIIKLLVISKATAGEKHPQSGSQGACGPKNDPEATPEYKKMEKSSEKPAFFTFWPCWAKQRFFKKKTKKRHIF